ncbi:DUF3149 domain-containing protein [Neisseria weaveri]|nr:DUF3149 domain-containing protein [Neisseria weaveri]EGV34817.1 hypothetical protein l13_20780 [Neisseria weaveri ATCC 51223]EGV38020.1 hypothetical protein l11_07580 [Neisseria weaveri LMG 5135]
MELINELLKSTMGILSLFTITFIIAMAIFLFFWVKKQADKKPGN